MSTQAQSDGAAVSTPVTDEPKAWMRAFVERYERETANPSWLLGRASSRPRVTDAASVANTTTIGTDDPTAWMRAFVERFDRDTTDLSWLLRPRAKCAS